MIDIVECKGFTKEEAFSKLKFNPDSPVIKGCNATQAWHAAGKPIFGTNDFMDFIKDQLKNKTRNTPGFGVYIVVDPPIPDTRKRPYTVVNNVVDGSRTWKFVYWIREDEFSESTCPVFETDIDGEEIQVSEYTDINIAKMGQIVYQCESKAEAIEKMKQLTTQTHKSYSTLAVKVPDKYPIAAYCLYSPASNAKEGTFIACGICEEK